MDKELVDRRPTLLVQDFLDQAIRSGTYGPGSKLPTERALSERLRVPRSAVRDVLSVFEAQQKVVRIMGSGTYVAETLPASAAAGPRFPTPARPRSWRRASSSSRASPSSSR